MHYAERNYKFPIIISILDTQISILSKMEKDFRITTAKQYEDTMIAIFEMQEQEDPLTAKQLADMDIMMKAAERYEEEEL